ncbi:hypothetical protein TWF751_003258 [Orbilia oligospora]|nr:hypothetical protein TWF751_003258 [Orbilia oligospora]
MGLIAAGYRFGAGFEAQSQDGDKYQVGLQHSDLAGIDINAITAASKDKTSDDVRVADSYIRVNWTVDDHRIERTPSQAVTDIGIKKCCLYPIPGSDVYSYRLEVYTETGFWGEEYHFCDETKDLYRLYANVNTDIYSTSSWKDYSSTLSGKQGSQKLGTAKINKLDVFGSGYKRRLHARFMIPVNVFKVAIQLNSIDQTSLVLVRNLTKIVNTASTVPEGQFHIMKPNSASS